ncbi:hypothetical protein CAPTEDRAFT_98448 [Capitella teleta]|uniref:Cupin type-2 domain-containing protein n=1 Tax=Capitella teleta TaxID=283909 RepID=R7V5I6_CAPTE|nr:hypothetical protein CAPTEDRAFT_98448 [Capitella teleta]|eukprot:ELU13707.1 hypothetical protein CAPTEDRAFT_98448 [Capitella teleta]
MPEFIIEHWNETADGPLSELNLKRKLERQGYACVRYVFSPGTDFPDHSHDYCKKDAIATGKFLFRMLGKEVVLLPGDMIEVPKGMIHNAAVVGNEDVVFFDSTKTAS